MHSIYRYGHPTDVTLLSSPYHGERNDYLLGVTFVFSVLMAVAALWLIVLFALRLLGYRVGCASGQPPIIPAEKLSIGAHMTFSDDKGNIVDTNSTESTCTVGQSGEYVVLESDRVMVRRTRLVYVLSGALLLISIGLLLYPWLLPSVVFLLR